MYITHTTAQKHTIADSSKIDQILKAAYGNAHIDPEKSLHIAAEHLKIAEEIGYNKGIARSKWLMGFTYYVLGDVKNTLKYYTEALDVSRQYKLQKEESRSLYSISGVYHDIGDQKKAFAYGEAALKIAVALNDSSAIANSYCGLGIILSGQGIFDDAIKYYIKAGDIYHLTGNAKNEATILNYIGVSLINQKKYKEGYNYYLRSLNLFETPETYSNLGAYYAEIGNEDSGLYYFSRELELFKSSGDKMSMAVILDNIGKLHAKQGKLDTAEKNLKLALAYAQEVSYIETIWRTQDDLACLYEIKQDYKKANEYRIAAGITKDSLSSAETRGKIAELNTRFEVTELGQRNTLLQNENDLQKMRLERKNMLIYGALLAFIGSIIIALLLIRQNKLRADQQKIMLEQKQLRAQMNPHFIFNCLNSIQHFVLTNDVKNANKYLSGFASLMRQTLENSKEGTITLQKEIAYLDNYITLERMRFEDKFIYNLSCAPNINPESTEIPAMIIQPFIENSIQHGLCYLTDRTGELKVSFYKKGGSLYCEIDDNGIGRTQSEKLKNKISNSYESHGIALTRQRMELVSKQDGVEYNIEIKDKINAAQSPGGTTVIIKFPLNP